ncbi:hypothetical protein BHE74_00051744, partial [Ensete ventricosum]
MVGTAWYRAVHVPVNHRTDWVQGVVACDFSGGPSLHYHYPRALRLPLLSCLAFTAAHVPAVAWVPTTCCCSCACCPLLCACLSLLVHLPPAASTSPLPHPLPLLLLLFLTTSYLILLPSSSSECSDVLCSSILPEMDRIRTGTAMDQDESGYGYTDHLLPGGTTKIDRRRLIEGEIDRRWSIKGEKEKRKRRKKKRRRKKYLLSPRCPRPLAVAVLARGSV